MCRAMPRCIALLLVPLLILSPASTKVVSAADYPDTRTTESVRTGWSAWSVHWNAVAADGDSFWLAADGRLLRWSPAAGVTLEATTRDGLPHVIIYDVIADGQGGIWISGDWISGDGGLSRRNAAGDWQHVSPVEPPRADDGYLVAGADGQLWLASAASDAVFRYDASGAWTRYTDVRAAIEADFAAILASVTRAKLWTVSHGEVWHGFSAYDGVQWHERPAPDGDMADAAQDAAGNIYLHTTPKIFKWDGVAWAALAMDDYQHMNMNTHFAVTPDGVPWQVDLQMYTPSVASYVLRRLTAPTFFADLGYPANGSHFIARDDGLWLFGAGWVRHIPPDDPDAWTMARVDPKTLRLHLRNTPAGDIAMAGAWPDSPYVATYTLATWADGWQDFAAVQLLDKWEYASDGALWYVADVVQGPSYLQFPTPPRQRMGDALVEYPAWPADGVHDLWALHIESPTVVWFGVEIDGEPALLRLDNRGTPADFDDDQWTRLALPDGRSYYGLVQDANGRLWTSATGNLLLRLDGTTWREIAQIRDDVRGLYLVPAADGTLFVVYDAPQLVFVVRPDGTQEELTPTALATDELARLLTTRSPNPRWVVVGDALWFTRSAADGTARELVRRTPADWTVLPLPAFVPTDQPLLADRAGDLWTSDGDTVWRWGPLPDFALQVGAPLRLLPPDTEQTETLGIESCAGFTRSVTLAVTASPGLQVTLAEAELVPDTTTAFTIGTPAATGTYSFTVTATSGPLIRHATIGVIVSDEIDHAFLPLIRK